MRRLLPLIPLCVLALACNRSSGPAVHSIKVGSSASGWRSGDRPVSPTSLERYAKCGYQFFCHSVLRLRAVEEPEEMETLDARTRGSLIHRVLERFFKAMAERGRPVVAEAWHASDLDEILGIAREELGALRARGLAGLDVYADHELRSLKADLRRFLHEDSAFRVRTGAVPRKFEVQIEDVDLDGVRLRGVVDRVDVSPDGKRAWVIDYKSGSAYGFESLGRDAEDPFVGGTKLQLAAYVPSAGAVEEVYASYWFVTRRAGFLFRPDPPLAPPMDRFAATVGAIVAGAEAGAFPAVPGEESDYTGSFDNCQYCDFDRICSRRRADAFAEKAEDPWMAPWHAVRRIAKGETP